MNQEMQKLQREVNKINEKLRQQEVVQSDIITQLDQLENKKVEKTDFA
jgi:hypothetical protein